MLSVQVMRQKIVLKTFQSICFKKSFYPKSVLLSHLLLTLHTITSINQKQQPAPSSRVASPSRDNNYYFSFILNKKFAFFSVRAVQEIGLSVDVELFNVSTFLFLERVVTPTKLRAEIHQDPMGVHRNSFKRVGETKTEKRNPKSCKDPLII